MGLFSRNTPAPVTTQSPMRRITKDKRKEIARLLDSVCTTLPNGMVQYSKGWHDRRVADTLGCADSNVAYIRKRILGPVKNKSFGAPTPIDTALRDRLLGRAANGANTATEKTEKQPSKFLHERFSKIEEEIRQLREDLTHLKSDLGVNY